MQFFRKLSPLLIIALIFQLLSPLMFNNTATTYAANSGPEVISRFPAANTTNAPLRPTIELLFDENIEANDTDKSIRIRREDASGTELSYKLNTSQVRIVGSKLSVTLPNALDINTTYMVTLENSAVRNVSNKAVLNKDEVWTFRTIAVADNVRPTLSAGLDYVLNQIDPATGNFTPTTFTYTIGASTYVPINAALKLTFDEPVHLGTGEIRLRNASGTDDRNIPVYSSEVQGAGSNSIIIRPNKALLAGQSYTLTIQSSNFEDAAGNPLASNYPRTFTTAADAIQLNSRIPSTTTDVELTSNRLDITLNFSKSVVPVFGKNITVRQVSNNTIVANPLVRIGNPTGSTSFSYTVFGLSPNTDYYITVDEGSFVNANGANDGFEIYRGITDATNWRFKTKATVDTQPPTHIRNDSTPANNATQIPMNANIVLKFNEPVFANSGNILVRDYSTGIIYRSISVTSSRVTGVGTDTITIDPHSPNSSNGFYKEYKRYYVEIPSGAFRDASNNPYAGINDKNIFNFTTGDKTNSKPLLASISPINGDETIVAWTPQFKVSFDKEVFIDSTSPAARAVPKTITTTNQPINLAATVDSSDRKTVILVPQTALNANTDYYITIPSTLIRDSQVHYFDGIENTYQWTFKTLGGDRTAPKVMRAEANNNKIRLVYDELLKEDRVPPIASFYITIDGVAKNISSIDVEKNAVVFTMYENVRAGQHVFVSYTRSASTPLQDLTGNEAVSFVNQSATIGQITSIPTVTSSSYSGNSVTLEFNEPLQKVNAFAYLQFAVRVNNVNNPVTSITQNGSRVTLGVTNSIASKSTVVVNYTKNSYPLQGFSNDVTSFTHTVGTGVAQATTAPEVASISANSNEVRIMYNQPVSGMPYSSQFSVFVDGSARSITNVKLENQTVILTLSSPVQNNSTVSVSYSASPTILLSTAGNNQFAPSYQNKTAVVGATNATGKVTLQSAIARGNTITLGFNKQLDPNHLPTSSQFYVLIDGNNWSVRNLRIDGHQLILTLPSVIAVGAEGTISYYTTSDTLRATDGERADMISNVRIANQSTVIDVLSDEYASISTGVLLKESTATKSNSVSPSGRAVTQYNVDNAKITTVVDTLADANIKDVEIRFEVPTTEQAAVVAFPLAALQNAASKGQFKFTVKYGDIYFEVPTASVDVAKAVNLNKGSAFSNNLVLKIESGSNSKTTSLESAIRSNNATLVSGPYLFEADVVGPAGRSDLPLKGNLIRKVTINTTLNTHQTGAVFYDEVAGNISGMPTTFLNNNGRTDVTFMRPGSSAYAVVTSSKTFSDTVGHWANSSILILSRKFVAEGHSATAFNPQRNITRGEFATYLAKGLGLSADKDAAKQFRDVNSSSMLGGYIGAAAKAGIVSGVSANEFKPNAYITRQDMAIMMMRVVSYTKMDVSLTTTPNSYLSRFNDANKVSSYARTQVAQAIQIGVITGTSMTMISPLNNATRAEGVTMIERVLRKSNYIQ